MDPISQGALGAVAAQNLAHRKHLAVACVLGLLAGMSADLDIFIRSDADPLLFLKYHRQFTHSLIFIPVGGLICASILWFFVRNRWQVSFRQALLYCTTGYATHALLDSCTSYGTQLFWPFSDYRVSWSNMSIIDPLFTLPTVVLIVLAAVKKKSVYIRIAAVWILAYLAFGFVQKERTRSTGWEVAQSRGHAPVSLEAKPGFGNLLLWKVIYETEDKIYVVGVRAGIRKRIYPGNPSTNSIWSVTFRGWPPIPNKPGTWSGFAGFRMTSLPLTRIIPTASSMPAIRCCRMKSKGYG